jgi:hypothetical protein
MKASRPVLGIWAVALIIVAAMLTPQLNGSRKSEPPNSAPAVRRSAAVGYAKARLWNQFLQSRAAQFEGHELPAPTLAEYRQYLRSVGLWEIGDEVSLMVFPAFEGGHQVDRVEVALSRHSGPIELRVALWENNEGPTPVGALTIQHGKDGDLVCRAEQLARPLLWSYWPITPKPILP